MRSLLPLLLPVLAAVGCSSPVADQQAANDNALDSVRWSLIDAQDHRDTKVLAGFLADTSAAIRARAALAFASVGDSAAVPALLKALNDNDPSVRANAAFAFGFCGDSLNVHQLIERFSPEENAAVRGRIAEAAGRCGRKAGADLLLRRSLSTKADSLGVLRGLFFATSTGSTDTSHVRYALSLYTANDTELDEASLQVAARSRADLVKPMAGRLLDIAMTVPDSGGVELRLPLLVALGKTGNADAFIRLQESLVNDPDPRMRAMALRGIGRFDEPKKNEFIWNALKDSSGMVRDLAVEQMLTLKELPDGQDLWNMAQEHYDYAVKIPLYGLVMKTADADTRRACRLLLQSTADQGELGPYLNAALIKARANDAMVAGHFPITDTSFLRTRRLITGANSAIERIASLETCIELLENAALRVSAQNGIICWSCLYDRTYMDSILTEALVSGDPGLIARTGEYLMDSDTSLIRLVLDDHTFKMAFSRLHSVRDLEARQNLDACAAKIWQLTGSGHKGPPFNHSFDRARLANVKAGQQYRIVTSQGDIILALEPDAAPGSCAAFDSLVIAGYYNGKFFHRVVPDFVAQAGCPRGDGYGGMPWTLRTEIGQEGFTTGAVGLASAGKDTESCQFFIMLADAPHLDGRYTRFAHVVRGMDVAWKLRVGDVMTRVERIN
jgi:cyclophilin family peptidyl-prolyl cis-trans isomerase/HEAT repeat protein